jgi:hypothetical protein
MKIMMIPRMTARTLPAQRSKEPMPRHRPSAAAAAAAAADKTTRAKTLAKKPSDPTKWRTATS